MKELLFSKKAEEIESFRQKLKEEIERSTGQRNVTVRIMGESIIIHVRASLQVILDRIFGPLIDHQPTWVVKRSGWHHIFINHRGLDSVKFNYNYGTP